MEGGWPTIMQRNRKLALEGRGIICEALGTSPPVPDSMVSSIASIEIPSGGDIGPMEFEGDPFHNLLYDKYRIQVPVFPWVHHNTRYIRISAQIYNHIDEYNFLAEALKNSL